MFLALGRRHVPDRQVPVIELLPDQRQLLAALLLRPFPGRTHGACLARRSRPARAGAAEQPGERRSDWWVISPALPPLG